MKSKSLLLIILFFCSCNSYDPTEKLPDKLEKFDRKHASFINGLCDTLIKVVGQDSSYVMEFRPRSSVVMFSYQDDKGNGMGYFEPGYQLSPALEVFFNDGSIASINYNKKLETFTSKLFTFKDGDKAIRLTVFTDTTRIGDTSNVIYRKDNRIYSVVDAW